MLVVNLVLRASELLSDLEYRGKAVSGVGSILLYCLYSASEFCSINGGMYQFVKLGSIGFSMSSSNDEAAGM
jgi:hypothetical protein